LRGDVETWNSIKNFIKDKHNADVFIHTWITYEDKFYAYDVDKVHRKVDDYTNGWNDRQIARQSTFQNNIKSFLDILKPVRLQLDLQKIFDNTKYFENSQPNHADVISYQNSVSQLYSREMSIKLCREYEIENNSHYDFIIQVRSDILFNNHLDVRFHGLSKNNTDTVVYGDKESMIKYGNIYNQYVPQLKFNCSDLPIWHMEHHLDKYLKSIGIFINYVIMPFVNKDHGIKRIDKIG
jgi:virulence-associated protein VapD